MSTFDQQGVDRRSFLKTGAVVAGGLALAGPLQMFSQRASAGALLTAEGYGPLVDMGALALPKGFRFTVVQREGDPMTDGNPVPGAFDGMGAFPGKNGRTILMRNHEIRPGLATDRSVKVPSDQAYDPFVQGGVTKVVVDENLEVAKSSAVLGGTVTNCAGGKTPWGSWITCEEQFVNGMQPHGYAFEVSKRAKGPVTPEPIKAAGRFVREAVAWLDGALYQTEDAGNASFYRYIPDATPTRSGDLAKSTGLLQALAIKGEPTKSMTTGIKNGATFDVEWVDIEVADPATDTLRAEAQAKGAAIFTREEGIWAHNGRIYFDCTNGGDNGLGQIFEYDPNAEKLRLIYQSEGAGKLNSPDNLCSVPKTGDLFLCEDTSSPQFVRGLTTSGQIYDFAKAIETDSEFCGATFSADGKVLFVNQQRPGITYAIKGPWRRRVA